MARPEPFVVVLAAALLLPACGAVPREISQSGSGAYEASVRAIGESYVVAWHDYRHGNSEVYARVLDLEGRPRESARRLTHTPALSFEADVDGVDGDMAIAWYERPPIGRLKAMVGVWSLDGEARWQRVLSSSSRDGRNPVVLADDTAVFCAWIEEDRANVEIWAIWLTPDGQPHGQARRIASAGPTTWNLNGVLDDQGHAWVVFDATVGTQAEELFLARLAPGSTQPIDVVRLTSDDGYASKYPDLALSGAAMAMTWFDERDGNREVYLAVFADGWPVRGRVDRDAVRVTHGPGESIGAYVAWSGDRLGLAWSDELEGQHEIFFQAFSPGGHPLDGPRRLTTNETASLIPAIEPAPRGFALAWNEDVIAARGTHQTGGRSEIMFSLVP